MRELISRMFVVTDIDGYCYDQADHYIRNLMRYTESSAKQFCEQMF